MALRLRSSKRYIGVYFAPSLNKWRAIFGKNTKTVLGDFTTEIEAAKRYNEYVRERDGFNAGFLLSRVNDLPEEQGCAPAGGADERARPQYFDGDGAENGAAKDEAVSLGATLRERVPLLPLSAEAPRIVCRS
jgi:hypothetical protein